MRNYKWWSVFNKTVCCLLIFTAKLSLAAVNIDRTRVVFSAQDQEQSVNLSNDGKTPMLLQVWTDFGDLQVTPDNVTTPVVVLPPFFKMQPGELRSLRLMLASRKEMPEDREGLLWLNIYQVAPMLNDDARQQEKVMLPLRFRLKIFIRPAALDSPQPEDERKLVFKSADNTLEITNPTPWYMSLVVTLPGQPPLKNIMVPPYGVMTAPLTSSLLSGREIQYSVITDEGNYREYSKVL